MIQKKEEDTTQPSPIKPESQKPVRAKRTKIINPAEEHAEIIEPVNDAIVTKIIEETITISVEGEDDNTTVVPDKKNSKKNTKKTLKMKDKDKKKAKKADAKEKAKAKAKKAKKTKKDKAKKTKVKAKIKAKKAKAKSKKVKKNKKNKK